MKSHSNPTGHISTAEIYAGAGVPFGESLRRCADALKQIEASLAPHLEPEKGDTCPDCGETIFRDGSCGCVADELGPQVEEVWGTQRYV
jgi:predicted RNA-binding Zn-ribbon protein involved in translation (DUF1610 family)